MILPPLIIAMLAVGSALAADSSADGPGTFVPIRKGKGFQRFGMVLMGGTNFSDAATQATFQSFRELENGRALSNYVSVGRDPLPNHVAAIAGTTVRTVPRPPSPSWRRSYLPHVLIESPGVQYGLENCPGGADSLRQCRFDGTSLIDLFEALNVSYRFYAEDYQGGCDLSTLASSIPALHSTKVQETPEWCEKVVNAAQFQNDISSNNLPQVWFYIPNTENGRGPGISPNQNRCISTVFIPLLQNAEFSKDLLFVLNCTSSPPHTPFMDAS